MASYFENDVITKWLTGSDEDRDVELTADFAFVEPTERWEGPPAASSKAPASRARCGRLWGALLSATIAGPL